MTTSKRKGIPLSVRIMVGMAVGVAAGLFLGKDAAPLGELGKLVIQLIKAAAAPLLFLAIVNAILTSEVSWRNGMRMAAIATFNASVALLIGLTLSNVLQPGRHLRAAGLSAQAAAGAAGPGSKPIDFIATVASFIPTSFVQPFADNMIITLVVLALFLGAGLRKVKRDQLARGETGFQVLEDGAASLLQVLETALGWIVQLVPLAVFGVVAKSVGENGFAPVRGLAAYLGTGLLGFALHVLVTYQAWLFFYVRMDLGAFWRNAKETLVYSIGANSSLATLPLTLRALDRMGVSKASSTLGACVGTNLNNDGIILYEAMAVLFVAQAHGIELTLAQQLSAAVSCMIAAMGIAGVPEAGFVSLSLVLVTVGLPTELLPLLLTVDWIIARGRTVVNVLSDMLVSILLDRWDGNKFSRRTPAPDPLAA